MVHHFVGRIPTPSAAEFVDAKKHIMAPFICPRTGQAAETGDKGIIGDAEAAGELQKKKHSATLQYRQNRAAMNIKLDQLPSTDAKGTKDAT